jgi:small subunit ribosomal protein S1
VGLVHISEISAEKRINHPQDALKAGQIVRAQVLAIDLEKRQIKLSMEQLIPTDLDEYLEEHLIGDVVSGRLIECAENNAIVELGEGIRANCAVSIKTEPAASSQS